jgi:hypothetical protein
LLNTYNHRQMKNFLFLLFLAVSLSACAKVDTIPACITWLGDPTTDAWSDFLTELDTLAVVVPDTFIVARDSLYTDIDTITFSRLFIKRGDDVFNEVPIGGCLALLPDGPFVVDVKLWENVKAVEPSPGGGGAQFSVTEYKTPGTYTYTVPAGAIALRVVCIGGGGGGGSGRIGLTNANRAGGTGGWSGGVVDGYFLAYDLDSASYTVKVGAGGAGGAAQTSNNADGNAGSNGGVSSFSTFFQAPGGPGSPGGGNVTTSTSNNFTFSNGLQSVINYASFSMPNGPGQGRTTDNNAAAGRPFPVNSYFNSTSNNISSPGSGAGGSGVNTSNVAVAASTHTGGAVFSDTSSVVPSTSFMTDYTTAGGAGASAVNDSGSTGASHVPRYWKYSTTFGFGAGGGGGGGSNSSTPAGDGGNGGNGGGGGGGGGGGTNGGASGAGGAGGNGGVLIIAFY